MGWGWPGALPSFLTSGQRGQPSLPARPVGVPYFLPGAFPPTQSNFLASNVWSRMWLLDHRGVANIELVGFDTGLDSRGAFFYRTVVVPSTYSAAETSGATFGGTIDFSTGSGVMNVTATATASATATSSATASPRRTASSARSPSRVPALSRAPIATRAATRTPVASASSKCVCPRRSI